MKLFIIIICLISERYLTHMAASYRVRFFSGYFSLILNILKKLPFNSKAEPNLSEIISEDEPLNSTPLSYSFLNLALAVLPMLLAVWLVEVIFGSIFWGLFKFIIDLIIFYLCIGPDNIFYPLVSNEEYRDDELVVSKYFVMANQQVFALIFWFIVTGPFGIIFYRLANVSRSYALTYHASKLVGECLDWVTSRITGLLYLLAGNFQRGFSYFAGMLLADLKSNDVLLSKVGSLAAKHDDQEVNLIDAENLVEHSLIIYLVLLAFLTLVAWM